MLFIYTLSLLGILFLLAFLELILFGSKVDPDDNGMLRTPRQRQRYKDIKLKRRGD